MFLPVIGVGDLSVGTVGWSGTVSKVPCIHHITAPIVVRLKADLLANQRVAMEKQIQPAHWLDQVDCDWLRGGVTDAVIRPYAHNVPEIRKKSLL